MMAASWRVEVDIWLKLVIRITTHRLKLKRNSFSLSIPYGLNLVPRLCKYSLKKLEGIRTILYDQYRVAVVKDSVTAIFHVAQS